MRNISTYIILPFSAMISLLVCDFLMLTAVLWDLPNDLIKHNSLKSSIEKSFKQLW